MSDLPAFGTLDTALYWEHAREGRLAYQRCKGCKEAVFHPRPFCPYCWSDTLEWEISKGFGTLYSVTVQYVVPPSHPPLVLGIIALDEGYHMFAEITGDGVAINARVKVYFDPNPSGLVLPKFRTSGARHG